MTITSVNSLREHLQTAIELEHSTIPPYLCALYSIREGTNPYAVEVVQSVFIEEMLHLTLAANLLNAVGGEPLLDHPRLLPEHPAYLPHSDEAFEVSLLPFSREALDGFMAIEKPAAVDSTPEDDRYESIGQFYWAISIALDELAAELGEDVLFCGDRSRQVTDALSYGGGGRIVEVTDLASARLAMAEIVEQGEGLDHESIFDGDNSMFHPEREEVAHYFRFLELQGGTCFAASDTPTTGPTGDRVDVDWNAVYPMTPNPVSADHAQGTEIRVAMESFNETYCTVLDLLQQTFNGNPALLAVATGEMYGLKSQAVDLMSMPIGDTGLNAGPSFEWVPHEQRVPAHASIKVTRGGPYLVKGAVEVDNASGEVCTTSGTSCLCRCGGSRSKPFCDGTHASFAFDGTESADHSQIAERRVSYVVDENLTVYDDRTRCAHFGQCTDGLPNVFGGDPDFVQPGSADPDRIAEVVAGCPSGALAYALGDDAHPVEVVRFPAVKPIVDAPYRIVGGIEVTGSDGEAYEVRARQTLCRCGQSANKPFCDGSHWYAGFRDPLPPELENTNPLPWTAPGAAVLGRERYAQGLTPQPTDE